MGSLQEQVRIRKSLGESEKISKAQREPERGRMHRAKNFIMPTGNII